MFLFNASSVEKGKKISFATTRLGDQRNVMPGTGDLRVATAARLSATFPYVSPAARRLDDPLSDHIVDGGYYDNYGLLSLMEWLDEALFKLPDNERPREIVILRIVAFPSNEKGENPERGWTYQTWAPLDTFMNVREAAQLKVAERQLELFKEVWGNKGVTIRDQRVQYAPTTNCGSKPPLSWKLTQRQRDCITDGAQESGSVVEAISALRAPTGMSTTSPRP